MKCQFCGQELPDGAKFCFNCNKQIACPTCGKPLVESAQICVFCGNAIMVRTESGHNIIKYSETKAGKTFEASFSDETAGNVVSVFSSFITGNTSIRVNAPQLISTSDSTHLPVADIQDTGDVDNTIDTRKSNDINSLFIEKEGQVLLTEKRLKASGKTDYQERACLLFMLYEYENGRHEVSREAVSSFMKSIKLGDVTFRSWLSRHTSYFVPTDDALELSREGLEKATQYLKDVYDDGFDQNWMPGTYPQSSGKPSANIRSSKSSQPSILKSLDLSPSGKPSLREFVKGYRIRKSSSQYNLLFVYYLTVVLELTNVSQNHVFTCYRDLGVKVPNDIYHSLSDAISKNHWMNNISDLKLTAEGINKVEQEMKIQ